MKTTKVITSKHGIHSVEIERADWSIRFYSYKTRRHATRRVWHPVHGSDIYVQYAGKFWEVCTESDGRYDPWLVLEYSEVTEAPEPEVEETAEAEEAPEVEETAEVEVVTVHSEATGETVTITPASHLSDPYFEVWDDEKYETVRLRAWYGDHRYFVVLRGEVRSLTCYMGTTYLGGVWDKVEGPEVEEPEVEEPEFAELTPEQPEFAELTPEQERYLETLGADPMTITYSKAREVADALRLDGMGTRALTRVRNAVVYHLANLMSAAREAGDWAWFGQLQANMSATCAVIDLAMTRVA